MIAPVAVLAGPTAAGKTAAGLALARLLGAEILSADSRQVFKYLDIGTAKPMAGELSAVGHHLIGFLEPDRLYSAAAFAADARRIMDDLDARNRPYAIVGGSGLYLKALIEGLARIPPGDPAIRAELEETARRLGNQALHRILEAVDPQSAQRLRINDRVRIIRALEVHRMTGLPISQWHSTERVRDGRTYRYFVLDRPRQELYRLIAQRVDSMVVRGLFTEVEGLLARGYSPSLPSLQTVGYREVIRHLQGAIDRDTAIGLIKRNTRHYAKRQLTWFRAVPRARWLTLGEADEPEQIARMIADCFFTR